MRRNLTAALSIGVGVALASPFADNSAEPHLLRARNIVDNIAGSYDFVVVGGGAAGLVLGARLSEDANHTVLVLEAGGTGEDYQDRIGAHPSCCKVRSRPNACPDIPGNTYYDSLWSTPLNWAFETVPQANANNSQFEWPRGKVLGGPVFLSPSAQGEN